MIYFSCHSENFGVRPADETFSFLQRLGFTHIDIAARSLMPQSRILEDWNEAADRLKMLGETYHLQLSELFLSAVEAGGRAVSPASAEALQNEELFSHFETICRFAAKAGFKSIMGAAGSCMDDLGFETSFDNAAMTLSKQVEIAGSLGLSFHVEPSRTSLLHTPDLALKMAGRVPGLKYTLDFLHFHIQGIPLEDSLKLIPFAGHMHARQARVGTGKCDYVSGEIDYDTIVKTLAETNWDGVIAMEFWNGPSEHAQGIDPVEQNIVMRYALRKLMDKYMA